MTIHSTSQQKRPFLLTLLSAGSFIFGIGWIGMFLALIIYSLKGDVPQHLFPGIVIEYLQAGYFFILFEILLAVMGIAGVVQMWQMKKTGFYIYTTSKILVYFLPVLWISTSHLTYPALVINSILITAYGVLVLNNRGK